MYSTPKLDILPWSFNNVLFGIAANGGSVIAQNSVGSDLNTTLGFPFHSGQPLVFVLILIPGIIYSLSSSHTILFFQPEHCILFSNSAIDQSYTLCGKARLLFASHISISNNIVFVDDVLVAVSFRIKYLKLSIP